MRLPAFTRDGKTCNDCFGPVEYDPGAGMHFHTDRGADCLSGRTWANAILARGDAHLLEEPKEE